MKFYTSAIESNNHILLRGYENGIAFTRKVPYTPVLFVNSKEPTEWKSIYGNPLKSIEFENIRSAKEFIKSYEGVANFEVQGLSRFLYAFLNEEYPGEIQYDVDLISVCNIDIEVNSSNGFPNVEFAAEEITAITFKKNRKFYVFGTKPFRNTRTDVKYVKCSDERDLLRAFLGEWSRGGYPDVVTGWSIQHFDIPYLVRRITNVLGEGYAETLSPWKFFYTRMATIKGREHNTMSIAGIATLDYLEMYRKFTYTERESYKLDNIAHAELGEKKTDYSEYESLHNLYDKNYQMFIEYNIRDVELVDMLDDKLKLIELVFALAYDAKVNFTDVFMQVRMWDVLIHNHLWQQKIAVPGRIDGTKEDVYEGAYVKDARVGMHEWIVSFDLNSLYPHLIMQYNISPETIVNRNINISIDTMLNKKIELPLIEGCSLAANGWYFSNTKRGFLPEMMQKMYDDRVLYKNKMINSQKLYEKEESPIKKKELYKLIAKYDNIQMAKKIQLNSAYGAVGNPYFRYYDLRQATAITIGGQLSIRWVANELNEYMNKMIGTTNRDYIVASDTDSLYVIFNELVHMVFKDREAPSKSRVVAFLDSVCREKIEPYIDKVFSRLAVRTNSFSQKMVMKREVIADRGIWTAKKRYVLNVHNSEGVQYKEPKLKIKGLEAVKSSTPEVCRKAIKDLLKIIMNEDEAAAQKFIIDFREKFDNLPFEDIAMPRGVQELSKFNRIGGPTTIPIHVRAAMTYNKNLVKQKLTKKYETIKDGEKLKFCYMKMPNPFHENILGIISVLPKEFNMEKYIDHSVQFDKSFLDPVKTILTAIGWNDEKRNTLEGFFV